MSAGCNVVEMLGNFIKDGFGKSMGPEVRVEGLRAKREVRKWGSKCRQLCGGLAVKGEKSDGQCRCGM